MNPNQKHKQNIRRHDRNWKSDKFPPSFGQNYELHHDWTHGSFVYFLTPKEHKLITRKGL